MWSVTKKKLQLQLVRDLSMSRESGSFVIPVAVFLAILLIILPVSADNVTLTQTTVAANVTTVAPPQTTVASNVTTVAPTQTTTLVPAQTTSTINVTTIATTQTTATPTNPTATVITTATVVTTANSTGNVNVYSSPTGASILIDGVYSGTTPKTVSSVPAGNHILRLSLSGYQDYEGSIYVVSGQENQGYGTLQPLSPVMATPSAVTTLVIPVVIPVTPTPVPTPVPAQDTGLLGNSSVLVAIIGAISVLIAAGASVFTHVKPPKKEWQISWKAFF
jgi:hypothetical protein